MAMNADQIAAAVQAAIAAILPAMQPAQAPNPAVASAFAKSPTRAIVDIINYSSNAGSSVYAINTSALPTTFSLESPNIPGLLNE
eukprot:CAMPEP_0202447714 /NCGR_PEP_ID=MMETSP1360-20130828/6477_1 /ASSEMBLY_ACC=CAM_ASM_000848 /TAXON_ID=515479 /ORGANISM="Licmophora paradoxa, Strain CCMP2313" /LENGTH=84 /DNA_ID=CAMNT_0049064923 /DNA_START=8 /DNA_END=259 /DNA_ORIENTATION=+